MIEVLGSNRFIDPVELVHLYFEREANLQPKIEGFNAMLKTLNSLNMGMECHYLMNQIGCHRDRTTFRILINGLESMADTDSSKIF